MQKHQRELVSWLRDEYAVTDVAVQPAGRHLRLAFTHGDERRTWTIDRNLGDPRTSKNNRAELRRMLGPPADAPARPSRTLDEMTEALMDEARTLEARSDTPTEEAFNPVLPQQPSKVWQVKLAAYKQYPASGDTKVGLRVFLPPELVERHRYTKIEVLDNEHVKVSREPGEPQLHWSDEGSWKRGHKVDPRLTPFRTTMCDAVEDGGELLIHCPLDKRRAVSTEVFGGTPPAAPRSRPASAPVPIPVVENNTPEGQMRRILEAVQELEAASPYRLVRLESGRLVWRAPTIGLK